MVFICSSQWKLFSFHVSILFSSKYMKKIKTNYNLRKLEVVTFSLFWNMSLQQLKYLFELNYWSQLCVSWVIRNILPFPSLTSIISYLITCFVSYKFPWWSFYTTNKIAGFCYDWNYDSFTCIISLFWALLQNKLQSDLTFSM